MSGWRGFRRVFRIGAGVPDADREVDREIDHHFERTLEDLRGAGWSEADARAEALRRFGDEARYRSELSRLARRRARRVRGLELVASVGRMTVDALRGLLRSPALTAGVLLVMALGVGANATVFALLDRLFLRPPAHIDAPDEVRRLLVTQRTGDGRLMTESSKAYPDIMDWWDLPVFSSVAAYGGATLTVGQGESAERRPAALATASFFPLLGVQPVLGRFYTENEDRFGAPGVAVLGHAYWLERFGGDASVLGRTLDVGESSYTVIGVAPRGFTGVNLSRIDVWLPLHPAGEVEGGGREWAESRGWYWFHAVARLAPGVTVERAEAAATTVHRAARADNPNYDREARVELASLIVARTSLATREARVVPWLMGVALMVLLLTCANVANLLLVRSIHHERQTAIRLALGVSRRRLVGTVVLESVFLAAAGGIAAIALAAWCGDVVRAFLLPDIAWGEAAAPRRVLGFSAAIAVGAGILAGLVPALRSSRPDLTASLMPSTRGITVRRSALRSGLLTMQAAISVVLVAGTVVFVRSLRAAQRVDLGFDPAHVLLVELEPEGGYPGGVALTRLYREARERISALPGVERVAIATTTPFQNNRGIGSDLRIPGLDSLPRTAAGGPNINAVTGDFFAALDLRVLRGRALTDSDDAETAAPVAVVNEMMARLAWPDRDAIGACMIIRDGPCIRVVGVVENSNRYELEEDPGLNYYVPLAHAPYPWPPRHLMVRTADPAGQAPAVQRALATSLSGVRLVNTRSYRDVIDPKFRSWSFGASLFAAFALLAVLVAAVGLYSVLAFDVAQRRPELGVRSALGASRRSLVRLVVAGGVKVTLAGIAIGLAVVLFAGRWLEPLLFHVSVRDPLTLGAVAAAMLLVAAAASGIPGWRAGRIDPNEALRSE